MKVASKHRVFDECVDRTQRLRTPPTLHLVSGSSDEEGIHGNVLLLGKAFHLSAELIRKGNGDMHGVTVTDDPANACQQTGTRGNSFASGNVRSEHARRLPIRPGRKGLLGAVSADSCRR